MRHFLAVAAAAWPSLALGQPTRPLGAPDVEFDGVFSSVTGVRELSDRRVVVVDRRERAVMLVDFARGTTLRIGREGAGPQEIAQPASLLALPGDTTAVWDGRHARLFVLDPHATVGRATPLVADGGRAISTNLQAPRFADARGRLYFVGVPGEEERPDSLPIVRFDRRSATLDTVGMLGAPKGGDMALIGPPERRMSVNFANPFSPAQAWIVTRDGRVGVVRSPAYRLDWTHPTPVRGTDVPYDKHPVTEADKAQWRATQQRSSVALVADAGSRSTGSGTPAISSVPEPTTWPRVMPPFLSGSLVLADDEGRVWVPRTRALGDSLQRYDVFDAASHVAMRVTMAATRRIVGFGRGVVYTVRADDDDLLHLARHPQPTLPAVRR
jgi:hypothetical protein